MRSNKKTFILILLAMMAVSFLHAQVSGNKNVVARSYDLSGFDRVSAGGAFNVTLVQSDEYLVRIEADDNLFDNISVNVRKGRLEIETRNIRRATKLHAEIHMPMLAEVRLSGASTLKSDDVFEGEELAINVSGASTVNLKASYDQIETKMSGASRVYLNGYAGEHFVDLSGASKLYAFALHTENTIVKASGASTAQVSANTVLETQTTGASKIEVGQAPATWISNDKVVMRSQSSGTRYRDTTRVSVGGMRVEVIEGDSVKVRVGSRSLIVDERGNVSIHRTRKHRFNGHWAGVDLGFNGLLTPDFNMSYPKEYAYLDLRMEKSINVNVNFYEQNVAFNKAGTFGMVSGLGFTWNNYRFANNAFITPDSSVLKGFYMDNISVRKSKITNLYLTLPLMFEVQTKAYRTRDKMHFAAGVVGGWRIRTHSKIYYEEANKEFILRDPVSGVEYAGLEKSPGKNSRNIDKNYDSFHMRPFKLDASVRAGWGVINLFANYSLTSLFINDRGPELYPFAVGITLTGW
jgi:hypothetical protein